LPVEICDHAVIGAGAVVTRDVTEPGIYAGNPARLLRLLPDKPTTKSSRPLPV
jgi:acetyltransferase-like isoleucine patch superfamily enzyme